MISLKKTLSSIFITPLLGIDRLSLTDDKIGYINAYLFDSGKDVTYQDAVYLLFKPRNFYNFKEFLALEKARTANLLDEYDYEGGFIVLVYGIPPVFLKEMDKFLNGTYSQFSEELKELYPKVVRITDKNGLRKDEMTLTWRIFRRDKNLRKYWEDLLGSPFSDDMEVWSLVDLDRETLIIEDGVLREPEPKVQQK
jgi:hypothetical protein